MPTPAKPDDNTPPIPQPLTAQSAMAQKMDQETLWSYFLRAPIPLKVISNDYDTIYCNAAFDRLLGGDVPDSITTKRPENVIFNDDIPKVLRAFDQIFAGEKDHAQVEVRLVREDDSIIWVQDIVVAQAKADAGIEPEFALIVCTDISAQKEIEKRVEQSERMRSIGQLTSGVAHDFNNILTILSSYADLLKNELKPTQNRALLRPLQKIRDGIARGVRLTRQLSEYGSANGTEIIDLNEHIQSINSLLSQHMGESIAIRLDLGQELAALQIAPSQLDQIIMNLALNARDAMPDGGKLVVHTRNTRLKQHELKAHPNLDIGEYLRLEVRDNGVGMPLETQQHIFEPFFSTKTNNGSSGLGLATVYRIMEQLGGAIYVDSIPNQGTTFTLYFPANRRHNSAGSKRPN